MAAGWQIGGKCRSGRERDSAQGKRKSLHFQFLITGYLRATGASRAAGIAGFRPVSCCPLSTQRAESGGWLGFTNAA